MQSPWRREQKDYIRPSTLSLWSLKFGCKVRMSMGFCFWHILSSSYVPTELSLCNCFCAVVVSLFWKAPQVLAEVQKQMGFFDAELKDSKRRAEEMQQAPCVFWYLFLSGVWLCMFSSEQNQRVNLVTRFRKLFLVVGILTCCNHRNTFFHSKYIAFQLSQPNHTYTVCCQMKHVCG